MILFALTVLMSNGVVEVPASHWTAIDLKTGQSRPTVHVSFSVEQGSRIQALVLTRSDAARFNRGRSVRPVFMSGFESSATFRALIPEAGDYVLMLDNRLEGRFPAKVVLSIETSYPDDVRVKYVPEQRRRATVSLSLLFLGSVLVFSAVKFLRT